MICNHFLENNAIYPTKAMMMIPPIILPKDGKMIVGQTSHAPNYKQIPYNHNPPRNYHKSQIIDQLLNRQ